MAGDPALAPEVDWRLAGDQYQDPGKVVNSDHTMKTFHFVPGDEPQKKGHFPQ